MHNLMNTLVILGSVTFGSLSFGTPAFAQVSESHYFETNLVRTTAIVTCAESDDYGQIGTCGYDLLIQVELDNGTIKSLKAEVNEAGGIRVGEEENTLLIGRLTEKEIDAISNAKNRIKDNLYKRLSGHRVKSISKLEVDVAGAISKNFAIAYGTRTEKRSYRVPGYCSRSEGLFYEQKCRKASVHQQKYQSNVWRVKVGKKQIVFSEGSRWY